MCTWVHKWANIQISSEARVTVDRLLQYLAFGEDFLLFLLLFQHFLAMLLTHHNMMVTSELPLLHLDVLSHFGSKTSQPVFSLVESL